MLIIDSGNEAAQAQGAKFDWPGPYCLFVRKGAPNPIQTLDTPDDWFVFEFTSEPASTLSALRDLIVATDRTAARPKNPFLFLNGDVDAESAIKRSKAIVADSYAIDYKTDAKGDLQSLTCGEHISQNPLFVTFFRFMTKGLDVEHTEGSLGMMSLHLGA